MWKYLNIMAWPNNGMSATRIKNTNNIVKVRKGRYSLTQMRGTWNNMDYRVSKVMSRRRWMDCVISDRVCCRFQCNRDFLERISPANYKMETFLTLLCESLSFQVRGIKRYLRIEKDIQDWIPTDGGLRKDQWDSSCSVRYQTRTKSLFITHYEGAVIENSPCEG